MIRANFNFKQWKFPGGEVGIQLTTEVPKQTVINWLVEPANMHDEFFVVANLVDAVKTSEQVELRISYFPYARQDRVCNPGESHARVVFEKLLGTLRVDTLILFDVHSASEFTHDNPKINVINFTQADLIPAYHNYDVVIAPDKGAVVKAQQVANLLGKRLVTLEKVRVDGKVQHKALEPQMLRVDRALIVDDICDGGATFISAAKAIREFNPGHFSAIDLWVTHGIFSKGLTELHEHFDVISCFNLMNPDLVGKMNYADTPFSKKD